MVAVLTLKNTLRYYPEQCINCGMCVDVCPHAVFAPGSFVAELVNRDACMECGACSRNCPFDALSVQAGVGCAAALISRLLGQKDTTCCCFNKAEDLPCDNKDTTSC